VVPSSREPDFVKTEFYNDLCLRISPMHVRRQVVMRVRDKPHAVKGLRAHILTLAARLFPYNSFPVSTGMERICAKRDSPSAQDPRN
jgi:hypothetical protein